MRCFLFQVGSGPARSQVGESFAVVGWLRFRRFRASPTSSGLGPFPSASVFFSLTLSGFARSGPGVLVSVFSFLFFLAFPSRVPVK